MVRSQIVHLRIASARSSYGRRIAAHERPVKVAARVEEALERSICHDASIDLGHVGGSELVFGRQSQVFLAEDLGTGDFGDSKSAVFGDAVEAVVESLLEEAGMGSCVMYINVPFAIVVEETAVATHWATISKCRSVGKKRESPEMIGHELR